MADEKITEPRVPETKWIAKTPNHLPDNITCELWHEDGLAGIVQEVEIHRFTQHDSPRMKAFTGTVIIKSIPNEMSLTCRYIMKMRCGTECLNSYTFQFVGELPTCFNINEPPGYPEQLTFCVEEGKQYEFFAREI